MSHTIFLTLDVHWYAFWTLLENQSKYLSCLQIYHILWEWKLWNIWAVCDEKCFLCKQSITWLQIMRGQDWAEVWSWLWFELSEARLHPASCNVGGVMHLQKIVLIRENENKIDAAEQKRHKHSFVSIQLNTLHSWCWIELIFRSMGRSYNKYLISMPCSARVSQIDIIYFYNKLSYKCNISTSYRLCFH